MTPKLLDARALLSQALSTPEITATGSTEKVVEYFQNAVGGNCGFIVGGDIGRFAQYFARAAAGGCDTPLSPSGGDGACGFTIQGDYNLAWSHKYFESAMSGDCGFLIAQE